jgi:hypothetical protein
MLIDDHSFVSRRRRRPSITSAPPALSSRHSRLALAVLARKALGDTDLPIEDLIAGGTLAENLSIMARTMPEIAEPGRWAGLLEVVPARMRRTVDEKAREMGLLGLADVAGRPLAALELIENAVANG